MVSLNIVTEHSYQIHQFGGEGQIDSIARLFRSQVTIEFQNFRMNLKSPESMARILGKDPKSFHIDIEKKTPIKVDLRGDDEDQASEILLECLCGTAPDIRLIWNRHFDRLRRAGEVSEARVVLINRLGLHARTGYLLARTAAAFDAEALISRGQDDSPLLGKPIWARSILDVLMLGIRVGMEMTVKTFGEGAPPALDALVRLVADGFGEAE